MEVVLGTPDNIFEVFVNDFSDQYHRTNDAPLTDLEQKAMKIRRRYKNVIDYIDAVNIYNEYMLQLLKKYKNEKVLKLHLKFKILEEFVPPTPRMKNTKLNKFILKHKILLSPSNINNIDDNVINIVQNQKPIKQDEFKAEKIKDKEILDFIKNDLNSFTLKKFRNISDIDYLEEYFMNKNKSKNKKQQKVKLPSMKSILSGDYYNKYKDTTEDDEILYYRGQYLNRSTVDELQMYEHFSELGWDGIKLMKKSGSSKRATKLLKEQKKKGKKKNKKNKDVDDFMIKIMGDNDYDDFSDFEKDMLNFTSANIFN